MDAREAEAAGLNTAVGVVLGQKRNGDLLRFGGDAHIMVFAPSGAGKGIGFVQPNLHDYPGSLVCLDPKGENTIVAAERRRRMGQKVIILDPFGMTGQKSDTYNPLGALTYADGANVGPWIECLAEPCPQSKRSRNQDPAVPNGLLLLRRKTPLPRRSVAYFCSGAHTRPQRKRGVLAVFTKAESAV